MKVLSQVQNRLSQSLPREEVIVIIDFGPVREPSLISTAQVRSPLVKTKKLVLAFVAVTVVQPAFGYSD